MMFCLLDSCFYLLKLMKTEIRPGNSTSEFLNDKSVSLVISLFSAPLSCLCSFLSMFELFLFKWIM